MRLLRAIASAVAVGVCLHAACAEVIVAADFNDGTLGPFEPANYGDGEAAVTLVEGLGRDGTPCARITNVGQKGGAALKYSMSYERGRVYTITFWARAETGTARVSAYLDRGDWRHKFPGGYSRDFEVGEQWQQIVYSATHQQGRNYLANVRCNSTTPVLVDDIVITVSEGVYAINWALAANGGKPSADSLYAQYRLEPLNDGLQMYVGRDFTRRATATTETEEPHWVQVTFPGPRPVSRVVIYWAAEDDTLFSSRRFEVQAQVDEEWVSVAQLTEPDPTFFSVAQFDELQTTAVRILQPPGGGPAQRPNLLWVSEVEAY